MRNRLTELSRIVRLGDGGVLLQRSNIVDVKRDDFASALLDATLAGLF